MVRAIIGYDAVNGQVVPSYGNVPDMTAQNAQINPNTGVNPNFGPAPTAPAGQVFAGWNYDGTPAWSTPTGEKFADYGSPQDLAAQLTASTKGAAEQRARAAAFNNPWDPSSLILDASMAATALGSGYALSLPAAGAGFAGETGLSAGDAVAGEAGYGGSAAGALGGSSGGTITGAGFGSGFETPAGLFVDNGAAASPGFFSGATGAALKGAALGGLTGGATGGVKGALTGAALGAAGGAFGNLAAGGTFGSTIQGGAQALGLGGSTAGSAGGSSGLFGSGISAAQALGGAANLYSGIQGTQAAKQIAADQLAANQNALNQQAKIYGQTSTNLSPFITAGQGAASKLAALSGTGGDPGSAGYGSLTAPFTPGDLTQTPGYQFQLQQGTQALNRQDAASGNYFSGAALKEAQQFGQGLADTTYNDAYNQYLQGNAQTANILGSQSGQGASAAGALGGIGSNYGQTSGTLMNNVGLIQGAGINAGNNAVNQSLANTLGQNVGGANGSIYGALAGNIDPATGKPRVSPLSGYLA